MARRIKVFLDANTIISAFVFEGVYRKALRLSIENGFKLVTSEYVLDEVNEVLKRKFPDRRVEIMRMLALMDLKVVPIPASEECKKFLSVLRDRKDVPILTSAIKAKAEILLSGDKDFDKKALKGLIQVVNAQEFITKYTYTPSKMGR
ncbi:MAG: putative toxin-antitoxin system toxin component, PIN family [Firmicutes bacterium HGW-Firmicutes-14]|jgi:putative PIN family toxin of toxin-antitoxin system|nr:MAG: putative toxin-antitoxin system toxin component, PIN family [Firmicutes bacterium HGW-Firmicutes-14]